MKLYINGFWSGFIEKTNPVNISFFLELFEKIFNENIIICDSIDDSDILLETIFSNITLLFTKKWKYTFLFSGESRLNNFADSYDCVLCCERNNKNRINVPLFIPNIYCNNLLEKFNKININKNKTKDICCIISNPSGKERCYFLDELDKHFNIDYYGDYKNNKSKISEQYNSDEFIKKVSDYKFIVSMENSREDTYITEKILHGFLASNIPIYWGSKRVSDYFNLNRFINVEEMTKENIDKSIILIKDLLNNNEEYNKIINQNIFNNNKMSRYINDIVDDIKNLLFDKTFKKLSQIYFISNENFEPERYINLIKICDKLNIKDYNRKFISPTYKQTISDDIYNYYTNKQFVKKLRFLPMKKAELSLFLNYKAVLDDIEKNYLDGQFLILESDIIEKNNILDINDLLDFTINKINNFDVIHIGGDMVGSSIKTPYINGITPYRNFIPLNLKHEELSNEKIKLYRKYHTRCTDSLLWSYNGIIKFKKHMENDINYSAPFDYYLINKTETDLNFKHYWSVDTYFIQGTNEGIYKSQIQNDLN